MSLSIIKMVMKHSFISLPGANQVTPSRFFPSILRLWGSNEEPEVSAQPAQDQEPVDFKRFQICKIPIFIFR